MCSRVGGACDPSRPLCSLAESPTSRIPIIKSPTIMALFLFRPSFDALESFRLEYALILLSVLLLYLLILGNPKFFYFLCCFSYWRSAIIRAIRILDVEHLNTVVVLFSIATTPEIFKSGHFLFSLCFNPRSFLYY